MKLKKLLTGPLEVNTYVLYGRVDGECVIIDPSSMKIVDEFLEDEKIRPTHILITHGHFDHIIAVAQLQEKYDCKVCIHELDADAFTDGTVNLAAMTRFPIKAARVDVKLKDGDIINAAGYTFKVLHTAGHSKGGVSYVVEDEKIVFVGDTLFRLSVGRSDLPNCSPSDLHDSIVYKLFALDGDYKVYPGHMGETTLDFERQNNPFINKWSPETW